MKIIGILFLCFVEVYIGQNQNCDYIYNQEQRYQCIVDSFSEQFYYEAFLRFKTTYKKNYNSFNKEQKRYQIFKKNYKKILKHNLDIKNQYYQNINRFTDLEDNEFQQQFLAEEQKANQQTQNRQSNFNYYYPTYFPDEESEEEIIDDVKEEQQALVITPLIDQNLQKHLKKKDDVKKEKQKLVITPLIDQNLQKHLKKTDANIQNQSNQNQDSQTQNKLEDQQEQLNNNIDIVFQNNRNDNTVKKQVKVDNDVKKQDIVYNVIEKKEKEDQKKTDVQLGSNFVINQDKQNNNIQNQQKEVQKQIIKPTIIIQKPKEEKKQVQKSRTKFYYKYNTKTRKIEKVYF